MASPPDVPPTPIPPTGPAGLPSGPRNRPPNSRGSCLGRSLRWLALLGLLLAGAGGVASWFLWRYVHRDLAPQIEDQLGNILQRPVELGELESVTPYSIEFGPSTIAPTATDGDRLTTEGVLVNFNLLELLATRGKLKLNVTLQEPDLYLEQDADGNWVATDLNIQPSSGPLEISLNQLQLQGGDVVAVPYGEEGLDPEAKVNLGDVTGRLTTRDNGQQFKFEANGQVIGPDGKAQARIGTNGAVDLSPTPPGQKKPSSPAKPAAAPEIALNIKGRDLLVSDVKRLLENNITIPESEFAQGRLDADLKLILLPNQEAQVAGKVDFRDVTVTVPQLPQPVSQVKGSLTIKDSDIQLQTATGRYGPLPIQAQGLIDLKQGYQLTARVDAFELPQAIDFLEIDLPATVAGRARVQDIVVTGPLETPLIVGQLDAISSVVVDGKVPFKSAASRFTFQDSVIGLQEIRAVPTSGGLISGSGEIVLSGGKAGKDGRIRLDTSADGLSGDDLVNLYSQSTQPFRIGPVNAQARIEGPLTAAKTVIRFQALKGDYPARGQVAIADGKIDIQDVVVRAGGGVARGGAELVGERLRGRVQLAGISLAQFSDELRGDLEGDFTFSGPLDNLGPDSLRAEGIATLSEGISLINEPLTARVNWEGDKLRIGRAAAAGFEASGLVYASFDQGFAIRRLDLDVNAQGLELASLPNTLGFDLEALPVALAVGGTGSFRGKITGKPELPRVDGFVALRQFQVNKFPFESSLDGSLAYTSAGVTLNLSGQGARIALDLDPEFKPRSFLVSQGTAIAQGQRIGPDQLQVTLADFSLAALDFKPAPNISALGDVALQGTASGSMVLSLSPLSADGSLTVDQPSLGTLRGDRFNGDFSLRDNVASLTNASLTQGPSRYEVTGSTRLGKDPSFEARLAIVEGDTRSILQTLQWFDFADVARGLAAPTYGSAEDLQVVPVGLPEAPLISQLQRFSEIETLVGQALQRRREEERIPDLADLSGQFSGGINLSGSLSQGIKADFKVLGEDWQWGKYGIDSVLVEGEFVDDVITFQPVRVEAGETVVSLTGQFGGEIQQSGQLRAENVPVTVARNFIELPVALAGNIDMQAVVSGEAGNPNAVGQINLDNGSINGTPVQTRQTGFNYGNARLGFGGILELNGPEPVVLRGSIPYALPFSKVQPENDTLSINVSVKNEGLTLLDLLTSNQLRWLGGQGDVQLSIGGTLAKPIATGTALFDKAAIAAQFLEDAPLTEVSGRVRFEGDRILVDGLQGRFSDGAVTAQGELPLATAAQVENPLQVGFTNLDLNLRGLYRGGAQGNVVIRGNSLSPELSGEIQLADGQVLLPDSAASPGPSTPTAPGNVPPADRGGINVGSGTIAIASPTFEQLKLTLGKNVKIAQPPVFSFFGEGDLALTGNLDDPRLAGAIRLTRGEVNLFTSQFSLATRENNLARFDPNNGLDPELNIFMATAVTESSRRRSAFETTSTSEIQDRNPAELGSLQTIRIRATIEGPASQLLENITLNSSPSRSQAEIVSLIGGGFVDTLGRGGDSTLALANLAGSALLGNIQGVINNALRGPVELRLFPTVVESGDRKSKAGSEGSNSSDANDPSSSVFALGAEVGVNINNSTSFSALRLLTVDLPTQYNLRYQLNDSLTLRGTTDLQGDNRFVVNYEARF